jgi:hypothetical protein
MFFPWQRHRTWILEPHAQATVDAAVTEHPRIDEEIRGVEWNLVRSPEKGDQVAPDVYLFINTKRRPNASLITVLYTYNDNEVNVLRIWIR